MKTKILMVCLGNICRSPLAEGILKSKLDLNRYTIESCGTSDFHIGSKPDERSIRVAKAHHIDITQQRAAQFEKSDFKTYDYIYVMDSSNYKNIIALTKDIQEKEKVEYILNELHPKKNLDVPDPYHGGKQGFEEVFQMLDKACDNIASKLKTID
ncbi:low molecular weight protein-tyrosine-phosphatase [Aquimarina muelleri]|uniref:protein-tyrosine-phosphatase n=1 Tax=Aquimarina muelleri TaxID=279356 RepID=A0A918JYN0_9FLAO|nr:low molecular weight protein-tyrosine-phosphatase [Aquimarina muelleri]MCX2763375.1 low molecular weight phosphotyrosine protein phosphatase [Aquimarina muelleri]GGX28624.1 protein-tyrosine-phosphatase [Aquimarina muelleri]